MGTLLAAIILAGQFVVIPPPPPVPVNGGLQAMPPLAQDGDGVVRGVVRRADTGEAIRDAAVTLYTRGAGPDRPPRVLNATTDGGGKFEFKDLRMETYRLSVTREGHFAPSVDGTAMTTSTTPVTLETTRKTADIAVSLTPGGVITGAVRDANGLPALNIPVSALRLSYRNGRRALSAMKAGVTDDRGVFRLAGIPPGDYYVRADVRATAQAGDVQSAFALMSYTILNRTAGTTNLNSLSGLFSPTYAPGVADPRNAVSLKVRGGDEITTEIRTPKTSPIRISGIARTSGDGGGKSLLGFLLMPRNTDIDEGSAGTLLQNVAADRAEGRFEVIVTRPGSYDLVAVGPDDTPPGPQVFETGRIPVEIGDKDIEGIRIAVVRGGDLELRYSNTNGQVDLSRGVGVILRSRDATDSTPLLSARTGAIVNSDGRATHSIEFETTRTFSGLPEGEYQLAIPSKPPNTYVSDMRQGGRSIYSDGILTVGKTSAEPVDIVFSPGGAVVSGKVQSLSPAQITLVPQGPRRGNPLFYTRATSNDGTFSLVGVAPGEYRLFAFESLPMTADENAGFMAEFESSGRGVSVRENSTITNIELPLIRAR
jgi:hypothetical protein